MLIDHFVLLRCIIAYFDLEKHCKVAPSPLKHVVQCLSINESRLDEMISTDIVSIPGYEIIVKNRNRVGGGVAIYYRRNLNVMNRQDLIPANVEGVCLVVTRPKSKPILIASVYRSPNSQIAS